MTFLLWPLILVAAQSAPPGTLSSTHKCEVTGVRDANELHRFLSLRAIEIIDRVGRPSWETDERLRQLVAPYVTFNYGGGDVGIGLPSGVAGARALAERMHAEMYRFLGWDYVPYPIDPCTPQKVEVEFIDSAHHEVTPVTFAFEAGRLVAVSSWARTFESRPVLGTHPHQ